MCRGKPVQDVDFEQLAKKTDKFSGADLKAIVDLAIEGKLREAIKAGQAEAAYDKGPTRERVVGEAIHAGVVRDGAKLRAVFQSRRNL